MIWKVCRQHNITLCHIILSCPDSPQDWSTNQDQPWWACISGYVAPQITFLRLLILTTLIRTVPYSLSSLFLLLHQILAHKSSIFSLDTSQLSRHFGYRMQVYLNYSLPLMSLRFIPIHVIQLKNMWWMIVIPYGVLLPPVYPSSGSSCPTWYRISYGKWFVGNR